MRARKGEGVGGTRRDRVGAHFCVKHLQTSVEQTRAGVPGAVGRAVRLRRGADQPGDDTGPHAGQHAAGAEQGKPGGGRDRTASEAFAGTAKPDSVGEAGPLRAAGGDHRRARRSQRDGGRPAQEYGRQSRPMRGLCPAAG